MYTLRWRDPSVDIGKVPIAVPVGAMLSNKASVVFTGKGAPNYGAVQQTNMMLMLENFAGTTPPSFPTVGQIWFDANLKVPKVLVNSTTNEWKPIGGVQITENGAAPPANPSIGELWLELLPNKIDFILYMYTKTGRYPVQGGTIGGWAQIWPTPTFTGAREEYDAVLQLVNRFIGPSSNPHQGNAAIGSVIKDLTNLGSLDTSTKAVITSNGGSYGSADADAAIRVEPNSNDWDILLSAAKWGLNRLDLPTSFVTDIARVPFTTDGRPAPTSLLSLAPTDVRYPSIERRSNSTIGSITLHRMYAETMNALNVALAYRYSIRGISGTSGIYPELDTSGPIRYSAHATYEGVPNAVTADFFIKLNFASSAEMTKWSLSGGGFDIGISNGVSGGNASDIDLRALLQQRGFLRITQDMTRIFGSAKPLQLAVNPIKLGFMSLNASDRLMTTQQNAGGNVKFTLTMSKPNNTSIQIKITVTSNLALTSALSFKTARITDVTPNTGASGLAFGNGPIAFVAADATGTSSALTQKTAVLP